MANKNSSWFLFLLSRLTVASNSCLRAALGYKVKDIATNDLHKEAAMLTPYQKSFHDVALMFWRIVNVCEPTSIFQDLISQGTHNPRLSIFQMNQFGMSTTGSSAFPNRLNDTLSLIGDKFLDLSEVTVKKTIKNIILDKVPGKIV